METAVGVFIMVVVGLIVLRTMYRMITGKGEPPAGGCGCPACSIDHPEACSVHSAHDHDARDHAAQAVKGHGHEEESKGEASQSETSEK